MTRYRHARCHELASRAGRRCARPGDAHARRRRRADRCRISPSRWPATSSVFFRPRWSDGSAKNISFDGGAAQGRARHGERSRALARMVARFAAEAVGLVDDAVSALRAVCAAARAPASGRSPPSAARVSWRKDDSRLHVDAFPSRPNHGERILRVFCNVNPNEDRVWRVGESFEAVARRFLPRIRRHASPARRAGWRRCTSPSACAAPTTI